VSDSNPAGVMQMTRLYTDIALLRRGPEDVPVSAALLAATVFVYIFVSLALSTVMPVGEDNRIALIALDSFFAVAWYWVVLRLAGRPERFLQTTTAIFGYQTILAPAFIAGTWLFLKYMQDPTWQLPVSLLLFALAIWMLAVNGRILRAATGWPQISCVALVVLQALMSQLLARGLFPGDATP
jgi:hypothetical protein